MHQLACTWCIERGEKSLQPGIVIVAEEDRAHADRLRVGAKVFDVRAVYIRVSVLGQRAIGGVFDIDDVKDNAAKRCVEEIVSPGHKAQVTRAGEAEKAGRVSGVAFG
ncbi:MAG: hypothetical protein V4500_07625 [Pseudomonadota bacterium]